MRPPARVYTYFIDADGDWWCDGWPVDDPDLRSALSAGLFRDGGDTFVRCEDEVHPVTYQIAPLFVQDVQLDLDAAGALAAVRVRLHDGRVEPLRAATLRVDERDRLFCDASDAGLPALFFRPAYYRLMQHLEQDGEGFHLTIAGRRWPIRAGARDPGRPDPAPVLS